jgi:hypothetical protein
LIRLEVLVLEVLVLEALVLVEQVELTTLHCH